MTTVTKHFEEHHYGLEDAPLVTEWAPRGQHARQYQPYLIWVGVQNGIVWKAITVGYVEEPQYGPSNAIVREEWEGSQLKASDRGAPVRDLIESRGHHL
jgi:hypothetical protein